MHEIKVLPFKEPLCMAVCLEEVNDTWIEDASIAAIIVQLTALPIGLGSCWIQQEIACILKN